MTWLVLDIETVPDAELPYTGPPQQPGDRERTPAPIHNRIVVAGGLLLRADYSVQALRSHTDEPAALRWFTSTLAKNPGMAVVTYGGRMFDLPVIAARCWLHGIPFARYYAVKTREAADMRYRYDATAHLDLLDYLADHGEARRARLDAYARAIGFPGKGDVDGSKVAGLVADGRLEDVVRYNAEDVLTTAAILLRTQLVRGLLDARAYRVAMLGLLGWMGSEPLVTALRSAVLTQRALAVHHTEEPA